MTAFVPRTILGVYAYPDRRNAMGQRTAICEAFGWDYSDLTEYQPTRRMHSRIFLYQAGSEYVIAIPSSAKIPRVYRQFAMWRYVEGRKGWVVYETQGTK